MTIPLRPDIREQIDRANRALHADQVLTERLITDYLRPAGTGLPEPSAGPPPRSADGPTLRRAA